MEAVRVVDEEFLTNELSLQGNLDLFVDYSSCTYDLLPLFEIYSQFEDGSAARLLERWDPPTDLTQTGPASLIEATVNDRGTLPAGSGRYYLVRAHNVCGDGGWGADRSIEACPIPD